MIKFPSIETDTLKLHYAGEVPVNETLDYKWMANPKAKRVQTLP